MPISDGHLSANGAPPSGLRVLARRPPPTPLWEAARAPPLAPFSSSGGTEDGTDATAAAPSVLDAVVINVPSRADGGSPEETGPTPAADSHASTGAGAGAGAGVAAAGPDHPMIRCRPLLPSSSLRGPIPAPDRSSSLCPRGSLRAARLRRDRALARPQPQAKHRRRHTSQRSASAMPPSPPLWRISTRTTRARPRQARGGAGPSPPHQGCGTTKRPWIMCARAVCGVATYAAADERERASAAAAAARKGRLQNPRGCRLS